MGSRILVINDDKSRMSREAHVRIRGSRGLKRPRLPAKLCVVHLIRASLRYASKRDWTPLTKDLRLIYTAADDTAAEAALDAFAETWSTRYPTIVNLWRSHWAEFVPFLAFPPDVRRVVYTTDEIAV